MLLGPLPADLRHQADENCGVLTRDELLRGGVTRSTLAAHIDAGRWRQLNESVVVLHNGPLTREQSERAALLAAPEPRALCGLTAAAAGGLRGFACAEVHLLVQRGARVLPTPGVQVKVHESRRFSSADIWVSSHPARVGVARAIIDAAVWTKSTHQASHILVAGVQQRLVTPRQLHDELARAGAVRHRRLLRALLDDLEGGARALSEVEFLKFCRRNGFPRPRLNHRVDAQGRRRYLDATFTLSDGRVVRVEIDGGVHLSLGQRWLDDLRDNDLVLSGSRHALRFPSVAIYTNDARAVRQLRLLLSGAG